MTGSSHIVVLELFMVSYWADSESVPDITAAYTCSHLQLSELKRIIVGVEVVFLLALLAVASRD